MFVVKEGIILNGFEDICQLISKEDGYDCWRCLVCSKTVIVSCTCNRYTEKIRIIVNGFNNSYQEYQELCILCRCFSRIKKVYTCVCAHGPVVVFTASVDSLKWFLMKEANHVVLVGNFFHDLHGQLVVVNCNVCGIKYRSQLMLCRSNFVMFCFCRNTKFPELFVKIMHVSGNTWLQGSEVMIFHFLSFWCGSSQKCTSAEDQVFSLLIEIFVNQEVFLLRSYRCVDMTDLFVSKDVKDTNCFFIQNIHGTEKRSFLIQCLSAVGAECGRNVKCFIFDECR